VGGVLRAKRLRHRRANAQTKMDRGRVFIIRIGKRARLHAETDRTATSGGLSLGTMNALAPQQQLSQSTHLFFRAIYAWEGELLTNSHFLIWSKNFYLLC
jgi:hypothetical protein